MLDVGGELNLLCYALDYIPCYPSVPKPEPKLNPSPQVRTETETAMPLPHQPLPLAGEGTCPTVSQTQIRCSHLAGH